jgi:hypothetical protein
VCLVVVVVLVATLGRLLQVRSISRNNRGITKAGALATYKSTVQEGLDKELAELGVPPMAFPVLFIDALGRCSLPTCAWWEHTSVTSQRASTSHTGTVAPPPVTRHWPSLPPQAACCSGLNRVLRSCLWMDSLRGG